VGITACCWICECALGRYRRDYAASDPVLSVVGSRIQLAGIPPRCAIGRALADRLRVPHRWGQRVKHSAQDAEVTEVEEGGLWQEEEPSNFEWRSAKGIALLIGAIVVIFALILLVVYLVRANADDEPDPVAVTVPVALSDVAPPDDSSIGVVVTTGSG